jgi:hypothetical protein
MNNTAAIVEKTAEIFVSRARLRASHGTLPFLANPMPASSLCSRTGEAEVLGGVLYRANPFLPPIRHDRILFL